MQSITKRDLNQRTAEMLARATATDDIVVTERGKPRWRISIVGEHESALSRLEREGRYTPPAATTTPWPDLPGGKAYTSADVDALLDELRGNH